MKYIVATFHVDCAEEVFSTACELLIDVAAGAGFESFEDCSDGVKAYAQKQLLDREKLDEELHSFIIPNVSISYTVEDVEDKDWNESWEDAGFEPINIDNRCIIYDAKHIDRASIATSDCTNVFIEAKQSFGTGTHQTTQMVISELMKMPLMGAHVLDCGCGTGILGIVASMFGAKKVLAYDVDDWCVSNTKHNAELNGIDNIEVMEGNATVLKGLEAQFDVVVANINRNILLADLPAFCEVMKSGSTLIMSGFYAADINAIVNAAEHLGMKKVAECTNEEWACVIIKKKY